MAAPSPLSINFPVPQAPLVDLTTGFPTTAWWYVLQRFFVRTGGGTGTDSSSTATTANEALANAATAQATANLAQSEALTAQVEVATETARAQAAEALLAPKASPVFSGAPMVIPLLPTFVNDTGAASAGIVLGQLYWSSTVNAIVQRRV
jgi:hypothetical protein